MSRVFPILLLAVLTLAPLPAQRPYGGGRMGRTRPAPGGPKSADISDVLVKFEGTLRAISKKELELDLPDEQTLTFHRTRKTAFFRGRDAKSSVKEPQIAEGTPLYIEVKKDAWGDLEVVNIFILSTGETKASAQSGPR